MKTVPKSKPIVKIPKREGKLKKKISSTSIKYHKKRIKEPETIQQDPNENDGLSHNFCSVRRCKHKRNRKVLQGQFRFEQSLNEKIRKGSENSDETRSKNKGNQFTWHEIFLNGGCKFVKQYHIMNQIKKINEENSGRSEKSRKVIHLDANYDEDFEKVFNVIKNHATKREKKFLELKRKQFEGIYFEIAGIAPKTKKSILEKQASYSSIESEKYGIPSSSIPSSETSEGLKGGNDIQKAFNHQRNKPSPKPTKTVRFFKDDKRFEEDSLSDVSDNASYDSYGELSDDNDGNIEIITDNIEKEMKTNLEPSVSKKQQLEDNKSTMPDNNETCATSNKPLLLELQKEDHQCEKKSVQADEEKLTDASKSHTNEIIISSNDAEKTSETLESNKDTEIEINDDIPEPAIERNRAGGEKTKRIIHPIIEKPLESPWTHESVEESLYSPNECKENQETPENLEFSNQNLVNDLLAKASPVTEDQTEENINKASVNECDAQALLVQLEKLIEEIKAGLTELRKKCDDEVKENMRTCCVSESNDNVSKQPNECDANYPSSNNLSSWKAYSYSKYQRDKSQCELEETLASSHNHENGIPNANPKHKNTSDDLGLPEFTGCPCMLEMFEKIAEDFKNIKIQDSSNTQK